MDICIYIEKEDPHLRVKKILSILMAGGILISILGLSIIIKQAEAEKLPFNLELATTQENSLLPISNPADPIEPAQTIKMVVTAYSSTPEETDDTPFITASGKTVEDGIVANNLLPFGTEIRIPEIYGDKVFVIEDRMHWKKGYYHLDIWFSDTQQAKDFGAKRAYIEILES